MATQKVNIKVSAQGVGLAKSEIKSLEKSIQKMGKAVTIATGAYFGARGLISGLSTIVNLSAEQELAEKKLSTALGRTSKSLLDQASALQKVTTFGDEAIISQQAFLASLGFTEDRIREIIPVALDLSSATGMALDSAVRNLAKTFSGLQGELGETVLELKTLTQQELKAGDALKVISDLMGGSAQENTETLAGKLGQTTNAVLDAGESLGELLAPTVIATANAVAFLSDNLVKGAKFIGNFLAGGDRATETTNEFAQAQTNLASETIKANSALEKQKSIQELQTEFQIKTIQGMQDEIDQLSFREAILKSSTEAQIEYAKAGFAGKEIPDDIKLQVDALIAQREIVRELEEQQRQKKIAEDMSFETFFENQYLKLNTLKSEENNIKKFIELYPQMAEELGLINSQNSLTTKSAIAFGDAFSDALGQTSQLLATTAGKNKSQQIASMRLSQLSAVASIASGIAKAFEQGGVLGFLSGASIASAGLVQIQTIEQAISDAMSLKTAETGFEGVVTKPTLFLTGENNKPEQVSVVPLGGESSAGININIQGNMIGEESFVRDTLIPEIQKARTLA